MLTEDDTQTLIKLGLNSSQAKIYLTLLSLGKATAKKITQNTKIDNAEVYRQLEKLHKKAFIEKILKNPIEYKPLSLDEVTKILLQQRNRENVEVESKVELLLKRRGKANYSDSIEAEEEKISIIPQDQYRKKSTIKEMEQAQTEVLWYTQIDRIPLAQKYYSVQWTKNFARGVKHRTLAELNRPNEKILNYIEKFKEKHPEYDIRFTFPHILVNFAIFDSKTMHFSTDILTGVANSRVLITNNSQLVKLSKDYFEMRWESAMLKLPKTVKIKIGSLASHN